MTINNSDLVFVKQVRSFISKYRKLRTFCFRAFPSRICQHWTTYSIKIMRQSSSSPLCDEVRPFICRRHAYPPRIRLYGCTEVVRDDGVSSFTHNLRRMNMSPYNPILHLRALQEKNRATSHL